MDYGDVIVHIFTPEMRDFYRLEQLWGEAPEHDARVRSRSDAGPQLRAAADARAPTSSFGATCFLRLITPGSVELAAVRRSTPNARATAPTSPATSRSVPLSSTSVTISA